MVNGRRHDSSFKSKVALEAIKGEFSVNELASMYSVHPNQVIRWKKQALECLPEAFDKGGDRRRKRDEELVARLYQEIGQLKVELDFMKKKSSLLG
jgi:transposase-like protein